MPTFSPLGSVPRIVAKFLLSKIAMIRDPAARIALVRRLAALAAALLAAVSLECAAVPYTVRLGLEKIVLDAPPGFTDTTDLASPRLQDLAATLTADSNRVLLFALTDADLRRFTLGDQIEARRYMIAVTPKGMERERVSPEQFAALVADSRRDLGGAVKVDDLVKYLESQPIGRASLLAEPRQDPAAVTVLAAVRLPPLPGATFWEASRPQYQVFTTTLAYVRGKALRLSVFTLYDGPADLEWLRYTTQRWVDDLQRLNSR